MDKKTFLSKTTYLKSNLEKIWISLAEAERMHDKVQDAYDALASLHFYGDAYSKLQRMDHLLYYLVNDLPLDEEELDEILCFYKNRFK